jgi:hypothetical protein
MNTENNRFFSSVYNTGICHSMFLTLTFRVFTSHSVKEIIIELCEILFWQRVQNRFTGHLAEDVGHDVQPERDGKEPAPRKIN